MALVLLGSIRDFSFYENTTYDTYVIFYKERAISHPTTLESLIEKMDLYPKLPQYQFLSSKQ